VPVAGGLGWEFWIKNWFCGTYDIYCCDMDVQFGRFLRLYRRYDCVMNALQTKQPESLEM